MLNFVSRELAAHYFFLAFLAILGVLQLVAARRKLIGLSLWGSRSPAPGYLLGAVLTAGGFVWFFAATPEVFIPGLAGSELAILFGAAGICALAFTLIASSALQRFQRRERTDLKVDGWRYGFRHEAVSWQQLRGTLYLPEDAAPLKGGPRAAICALSAPSEGVFSPYPVVAGLVEEGFIVLAIDWGPEKEIRYPAMLGLLPGAVAYLTRRDEVNPERIGVLGIGLGGDLAIRSAGTDPQIAAVLALAPFLNQANTRPGLSILKEMTYLEALRWSGLRKRGELVAELAPLDYISKLGSRPLLLVYGDQDGIVPTERVRTALGEEMARGKLKSLPGEGHLSLPRSPAASALAARWFKENL
ncbi:MAG: alpha/beta hydrolase family protein [Anaerolineae bacterium]